jgi:hypothetical protein
MFLTEFFSSPSFRLPLPWFLYCCVFREAVPVSSAGMVCSITLLFTMLVLVSSAVNLRSQF